MIGADRREFLGGSDAAAALGISPWKTPLQLWQEKTADTPQTGSVDNHFTRWGKALEETILTEYGKERNCIVTTNAPIFRHPQHNWMRGQIDAIGGKSLDKRYWIVEAKNISTHAAGYWGESGTDVIPLHYMAQVQHYLAVCAEASHVEVAALIGGSDFRIYPIERQPDVIAAIIEREAEFWKLVETKTPPEPVNAEDCVRLWPHESDSVIFLDDELRKLVDGLRLCQEQTKTIKGVEEKYKADIQIRMRNASVIMDGNGNPVASWKTVNRKGYEVKPTEYRQFRLHKERE